MRHLRRHNLLTSVSLAPLHGAKDTPTRVNHKHDGRNHGVRDDEAVGSLAQPKAETAVDDAQDHENAAVPDVGVADNRSLLELEVLLVMIEAEDGLQSHQGAHNSAHLDVRVVEPLTSVSRG